MICETPSPEIINACRVLFSRSTHIDSYFLNAIAANDLKNAFRKRVMETHPDRAMALGRDRDALSRMFREVVSAYDVLKDAVKNPVSTGTGFPAAGAATDARRRPPNQPRQKASGQRTSNQRASNQRTAGQKTCNEAQGNGPQGFRQHATGRRDHHFKGIFPNRELKIGEFLYYAGHISWQTLIEAIIWQRQQRPRVGEIAIGWKILTQEEVIHIISQKSFTQKFCEYALDHGYFTPFQHLAVISRQKQLQPRFGEHFVHTGLFTAEHLETIARNLQQHNARMRHR
ncbi:MAG: DnaJ domain-containing protein [Thermodesulfobacteriota bacterium]|nr:DnaJ domain-containing protein [Thermodesulfobacteriota bacterium]